MSEERGSSGPRRRPGSTGAPYGAPRGDSRPRPSSGGSSSGGGYGDRAPRPSSGGGYGDRGPRPSSGGGYGDRGPRPSSGSGYGDRAPRPSSGSGYGDRAPRPSSGSGYGDRGPRPSSGGSSGGFRDRGPRPSGGSGYGDRGPRPSGGSGYGDRAPRPSSSGGYGDRGPRPSSGGSSGGFRDRAPRPSGGSGYGDRAPRPSSSGGYGNRGPRPSSGGSSGGFRDRAPRPSGGSGSGYGDRAPRPSSGGGYGDRGPRPSSGGSSGGFRDRAPRPSSGGGYGDRGPRPSSGSGYGDRAPRPSSSGGYGDRGPRPSSGGSSGGFRDRGPRPSSGGGTGYGDRAPRPSSSGGYGDRGPRPSSSGSSSGGFRDRAPRPSSGSSSGGFRDRAPRPSSGGSSSGGGFRDRAPRPSSGGSSSGGGFRDRGPRPAPGGGGFRDRGARPAGGSSYRDRAPRPKFDESQGQAGAVNRSRPAYDEAAPSPFGNKGVRWRRDGKPSVMPWQQQSSNPAFDDSQGAPMPSDPREAALRILQAVDTRSAFSDRLLDSAHKNGGPDPRDRGLLHELVKGTLRWRGRVDAALDARVHIGLQNVQPWIRNILRLGAYQIMFLDRVPAHAAVDEAVKLGHKYGHPGTAGLVNSVLRRLAEEKDTITFPEGDDIASLSVWGSHPEWIVERWLPRFGVTDTRALMLADNRPVATGLRVNRLKGTREELVAKLAEAGIEGRVGELSPDIVWVEGTESPGTLDVFTQGWCTAQDESEALVARIVDPQPHERILDLCAAPGGKSTHMAELMGDEGEVWAMERDAHRVTSLEATLARLGEHAIHVVHGDGRTYEFPMPFDRALVDAPCSGFGVLGRRADARWRKGPEIFAELPAVQLELLEAAAHKLIPGGTLVYSVCSFEPEETTDVVEKFLAQNPGFQLASVAGLVPDAVVTPEGYMRVLPHQHGCDGAFAARFKKA